MIYTTVKWLVGCWHDIQSQYLFRFMDWDHFTVTQDTMRVKESVRSWVRIVLTKFCCVFYLNRRNHRERDFHFSFWTLHGWLTLHSSVKYVGGSCSTDLHTPTYATTSTPNISTDSRAQQAHILFGAVIIRSLTYRAKWCSPTDGKRASF